MRTALSLALLAALALAPPAAATPHEHADKDCTAGTAPLPHELAGWGTRTKATAAGNEAGLAGAVIKVGRGVDAALRKTSELRYVIRPEKPGGSVSYGGMFGFEVTEPGTYRVALGSKAWIDVIGDRKPVTSTAHGHGPDCSSVAKMVDFPLQPGRYVLQLAASGDPMLSVLVTRLP